MKISRSAGYGMIAVGFIAQQNNGSVLASTIAKEYSIPMEYLLKILQQLVRANVLRSKRGPRGGFSMSRQPDEINMLEIIEAVSGPMSGHLEMVQQANNVSYSQKMEDICVEATRKAEEVLRQTKLSQMLES